MKISQMKSVARAAYAARQPIMVWGPPGVGKSSGIHQSADEQSIDFIDLRLGLLESIDLRGLPVTKGDAVKWVLPSFLPRKGKGIVFLDEFVQASPSIMSAASQLILDRRVGEYVLPDGWVVWAAGNRKSDRASTNSMPTHIANRFVHLYIEVSFEEWVAWALTHDIDIRVIAYLKWRPAMLHQFDPQQKGEAFQTPRSWEFASNMLKQGLDDSVLLDVMNGTVGIGASAEFVGFLKVFDKMPSFDAIVLDPKNAPIPGDAATLYAIATALVNRVTKDSIGKVATYLNRVKDAGRPDFVVFAQKEVALKHPEVTQTRAYIEWVSSTSNLVA